MARVLIASTAVSELRAVERVERRRRVVARLSIPELPLAEHRLCAPGRHRMIVDGLRVLYVRRADGTLVITSIAAAGDAVDFGGVAGALLGGRERS